MIYLLGGLGLYFLYVVLVFTFCFFQKEVKSSAWYISIYKKYVSFPTNTPPKNKLELACGLSVFLVAFFLQAVVSRFAFGVAILFIPVFDWLVIPLFSGKIPKIGFSKYFHILKIFDPDKKRKAIFYFPPILILLLSFLTVSLGRFLNGSDISGMDAVIALFIFLGVSILSRPRNSSSTFFENIFDKLKSQKLELK